jgi:hypothetical protein
VNVGSDVAKSGRLKLQSTAMAAADSPKTLSFRGKTDSFPSVSNRKLQQNSQLSNS